MTCIDKHFADRPFFHKEKIDFGDQYRIRFYRKADDNAKAIIALSGLADLNASLIGRSTSSTSSIVLPIRQPGIYKITEVDMMYHHGELRMTALLYVTAIDSNGTVLRNVEATSFGSVAPDLYSDLAGVRSCMQ